MNVRGRKKDGVPRTGGTIGCAETAAEYHEDTTDYDAAHCRNSEGRSGRLFQIILADG